MDDLIVVGGGPVGLATALHAVRAGLRVTVYEPRDGVIDKACGEGLMPGAVQALHALGVDPPGVGLRGIRYVSGTRRVQADFTHGPGRGVRRTALHAALRRAVDAAGVVVLPRRVDEVWQDGAGVLVAASVGRDRSTQHQLGSARYLVAADGLHSPLRRRLGLQLRRERVRRFGLRRHITMPPWTEHVEVYWSATAEAYVTPVAENQVGVAMLSSRRAAFADHLAGFPELAARIGGREASRVRGAGPLWQRSRRRSCGRVLLVGDAAGYVDALTGEGIAVGMAQAEAAVAAVRAADPESYETAWRQVTRRYEVLTRVLLAATRTGLGRRALVPAAAALPGVFASAVNELGRPAGDVTAGGRG